MATLFIDPGSLNQELLLEKSSVLAGEAGELEESWGEIANLWAQIEPVGPGVRLLGEQQLAELSHRITLRHRADISTSMHFRKGVRIFQILTLYDPDETGRYLVARVSEEGR
ncbi:phage head closure protein [Phyllobacterium ifriqiyense]|uniref:phage head closure protein n=1 Tax=Phyllobacterium ifriqiyense TaxID=314238 RepID=UPI003395A345